MSAPVIIPREMADRKPKHGQPCNNCGVCCVGSLCDVAQAVFDRPFFPGPCPALMLDADGRSLCGVALAPRAFLPSAPESDAELTAAALTLIGSGYGCDARINGEPRDPAFDAKLDRRDRDIARQIADAKRIWGVTR